MSIEKMSLVNIVGSIHEIDRAMSVCCSAGYFHPESGSQYMKDLPGASTVNDANPYNSLIKRIVDLSYKLKFRLYYTDPAGMRLSHKDFPDTIANIEEQYNALHQQHEEMSQHITENEQVLIQLGHMKALSEEFDNLFACTAVSIRFGLLPNDSFAKLSYYDDKPFFFFTFDVDEQYHWCVYFVPSVMKTEIDEIFKSLFFQRIRIPDYAHHTPDIAITNITKMLSDYRAELKGVEKELKGITSQYKMLLRQIFSLLKFDDDSFELSKYAVTKTNQFVLTGFVPTKKAQDFLDRFADLPACDCVVRPYDADPSFTPPVKLKNNWYAKPFEMFTAMYGLPNYGELDPTPLVAYTYSILFGIMFGDLGQGILLSIIGLVLWKLKGITLGRILARVGVFSAIFGTLYGSFFGLEHFLDPVFINVFHLPGKPVDVFQPVTTNFILLLSVAIGAVLITTAILINIVLGLRKKDYERSLFGHNGIVGLVFYVSVIAAAAMLMIFNVNVLNPLFLIFCIGLPLFFIFFREPLTKLLEKKKGIKPEEGIGSFIITNFFELFENILSYITNTLSFLRVGGFVLSHAGMMSVVLILMEMIGTIGSPVLFVIGNLFVMAMEGLIVGIQVLRLEFYEFFSRFYNGEGKEYSPVVVIYKADS